MRRPGRRGYWSFRLLRNFLRKQGFAIGLALRIDVNQDFSVGEALLQFFLDRVEPVMRFLHGPIRRNPNVELRELMSAAGSRAKVVQSRQFGIFLCRRE